MATTPTLEDLTLQPGPAAKAPPPASPRALYELAKDARSARDRMLEKMRKVDFWDEKVVTAMFSTINKRKAELMEKAAKIDEQLDELNAMVADARKKRQAVSDAMRGVEEAEEEMDRAKKRKDVVDGMAAQDVCVTCCRDIPTVRFEECGHQVLCSLCFVKLCTTGRSSLSCPMCRKVLSKTMVELGMVAPPAPPAPAPAPAARRALFPEDNIRQAFAQAIVIEPPEVALENEPFDLPPMSPGLPMANQQEDSDDSADYMTPAAPGDYRTPEQRVIAARAMSTRRRGGSAPRAARRQAL